MQNFYEAIIAVENFLSNRLNIHLHPRKISLRKFAWGIDFLGYVVLPHYILPRTKTKRRMFKKLQEKSVEFSQGDSTIDTFDQSLQSYLGYLKHANTHKLTEDLKIALTILNTF